MSNELQKRDDARAVIEKPVLAILRKNKGVIEAIAKGVLTEDRVFRLINAAITRTPELLECSPLSVLNSIVHITYLGLEIGPEMAYILPFRDSRSGGKKIATPIIDFRGLIRVAANADIVFDDPEIVYKDDKFRRWTDENGKHFLHEPKEMLDGQELSFAERGPIGAYTVSRWNGIAKIHYMEAADIRAIKKAAVARGSKPWTEHEARMWCKTVIRRAFKTLPRPTAMVQAEAVRRTQEIADQNDMGEPVELLIEGNFEDEKPFITAGTHEDQEKIAEEKIAGLKAGGADSTVIRGDAGMVMGGPRDLTPAESRALDEKLMRDEEDADRRREAERQPVRQTEEPEPPRQASRFRRNS